MSLSDFELPLVSAVIVDVVLGSFLGSLFGSVLTGVKSEVIPTLAISTGV